MADVHIDEVATELVVTEGVGSLSAEDVRRLVALVLEQLRHERDVQVQREGDTAIRDRAFTG
jgi:hypothetical protein